MTVGEYKSLLNEQIKSLNEFKSNTYVEFVRALCSSLPSVDYEKMRYNEKNKKTKYRAVDDDGDFASSYPNKALESDSIEGLAGSIAYYYRRSPFDLMVKDDGANTWRKGTQYENKRFDNALEHAFIVDEWH